MMVVITVSCCPPKLRGDLTKWLIEIDTGVFVGNLNARVRDAVWERICRNIGNGRASMAFSTNSEQKLDFRIHNTDWEPVDYDGIKLVRRNLPVSQDDRYREHSKISQQHIQRLSQRKRSAEHSEDYVVLDIETTGLQETASVIEIAALRIVQGEITEQFSALIRQEMPLPPDIMELTGITDQMLAEQGIDAKQALSQFLAFCKNTMLVGHNIHFDVRFLSRMCEKHGFPVIRNRLTDTMRLARKKLDCNSYSLEAVGDAFELGHDRLHRGLADCMLTYRIYEKLKGL